MNHCATQALQQPTHKARLPGVPLVLLHGWGCDSRVWADFAQKLGQDIDVIAIDLPGMGDNTHAPLAIESIIEQLPTRCFLLGWSLGGMLATAIADRYPERVAGLITLASNARFVANRAWPTAMPEGDFNGFKASLSNDREATLKRFSLLAGNLLDKPQQRGLRDSYAPRPGSQYQQTLAWLAQLDNRDALARMAVPSLHCFADRDALVPIAAAEHVAQLLASAPLPGQVRSYRAGHCLPLSRERDNLCAEIADFIRNNQPRLVKNAVARSFSNAAATYTASANIQKSIGDVLLQNMSSNGATLAGHVLDLGCGTAPLAAQLQLHSDCRSYVGCDLAQGMLRSARAQSLSKPTSWVQADAEYLPFAQGTFDLIFSNLAIQWCENSALLFKELWRLLRPGGKVYLSTLGPKSMAEIAQAWPEEDGYQHSNRFINAPVLVQHAQRAGFNDVEIVERQETEYFETTKELLYSLRKIGANNVNSSRAPGLTPKGVWRTFNQRLEQQRTDQGLPLTYDVYYLKMIRVND